MSLDSLGDSIRSCVSCDLCRQRTNAVPGEGSQGTALFWTGEAPGADEDRQGRPFVGRAGRLLDKMIAAMGFSREEVFISNVVKCRPPDNRRPTDNEAGTCIPYLYEEIRTVDPSVILLQGSTALYHTLGKSPISAHLGVWYQFMDRPAVPVFHPSYLLRQADKKREQWEVLKSVLEYLERG